MCNISRIRRNAICFLGKKIGVKLKKNPKFSTEDEIVIYENYSRKELQDLLTRLDVIKLIVCVDGTIFAWNGKLKTHEDIMRLLNQPDAATFKLNNLLFSLEEMLDDIFELASKAKKRYKQRITSTTK